MQSLKFWVRGVMQTAELNFLNFLIEYFGEIETKFENTFATFSEFFGCGFGGVIYPYTGTVDTHFACISPNFFGKPSFQVHFYLKNSHHVLNKNPPLYMSENARDIFCRLKIISFSLRKSWFFFKREEVNKNLMLFSLLMSASMIFNA